MIRLPLLCILAVTLNSCQDVNSALTPATKTSTDDFDGSTVVRQPPVSAASSLAEAWHTLGFDWNSRTPEKVFLTAGVQGTANIFGLDFNVGGHFITASETEIVTDYGPVSTRRFAVSRADFVKIATAPSVKMKVSGAHGYGVSSFGTATNALVNKKFPQFLQKLQR
jgi:hypothetical protein